MNKVIALALIICFSTESFAQTAYRSPHADAIEFNAWIKSENGLIAANAQPPVPSTKKSEINRLLERAQKLFVNGSLTDARAEFMRLTQFSRSADWPSAQRRAIHYAYLRVAQLSDDDESRAEAMRAAISFAPDMNPDREMFPPPFLVEFSLQKRELAGSVRRLDPRTQFSGFDFVSINGRDFEILGTPEILVFPGIHRIHLRSAAYEDIVIELSARELSKYSPTRQPFILGTCDNPQLTEIEPSARVFFSKDCVYANRSGEWNRIGAVSAADFKDFKVEPRPFELSNFQSDPKLNLKSPWLWAGIAGAVVTAILLFPKKNPQREPELIPSQRTGY